jgi:hypothetical protein
MIAMRMVQVAVHQVVDMVAVRNLRMAAVWPVDVALFVPTAVVTGCAAVGIDRGYFQHALIHMIAVNVVQVSVVQIIDVPVVPDRRVATSRAMLMGMPFDLRTGGHVMFSFAGP